ELRHIGFRPTGFAAIEHLRGLDPHQIRRLDMRVSLRNRKLNPLVLTDRTAEHDALARVFGCALDEPPTIADALAGNENALRIHSVQQIFEAFPFLADQVLYWHFEIVDEQLRRRMIHHGADGPYRNAVADRLTHIDEQNR